MKKILYSILAVVMGTSMMAAPVMVGASAYAEGAPCTCDGGGQGHYVDAALLTGVCDCGNGEGIKHILGLVVRIMTVGIGILATIGVVVSGIQYMTAGGNEERTRKSKRRIFEIVIGVLAYVLVFAVLDWLIPGFNPYGL